MLQLDKKDAEQVLREYVQLSGGVTVIDKKILHKDYGYIVGVGHEEVWNNLEYLFEYIDVNDLSSYGLWKNPATNEYVLDVDVKWVLHEEEALELAMKHKQIAVYDLAEQEDIKPTYIVEFYCRANPDKPHRVYVSRLCAKNVIFGAYCRKIAFKDHDVYVITPYEDYLKEVK